MSTFFDHFGHGSSSPNGSRSAVFAGSRPKHYRIHNTKGKFKWTNLRPHRSHNDYFQDSDSDEVQPLCSFQDITDEELPTESGSFELSVRQRVRNENYAEGNFSDQNSNTSSSLLLPCQNIKENYNGKKNELSSESCDFVELEIKEGDTLQSISLIYNCPVAELKRANNLISNQEFFGLRKLRIPVKKHGLLTEILPSVNNESAKLISDPSDKGYECDNCVRTVVVGIGPVGHDGSRKEAEAFMKRMDEDLARVRQTSLSQISSEESIAYAVPGIPSFRPLVVDDSNCNETDCGIHWRNLLVVLIMLGVVLPAVGAIYVYFTSDVYTSKSVFHNGTYHNG